MSPYDALHRALDLALSDSLTGDRQNALSLVLAQVRDRFSAGEFRAALRKVWPEPLAYKTLGLEEIEERMSDGLDSYRATGDAAELARWAARYLEGSRR